MKRFLIFWLLFICLFISSETQVNRRPLYHYSPHKNWMNDPNGLVYFEGEYHLFYQYHPYSTQWGPMHWGHAVSTDLLTWEELPIALYPDSLGQIFSGSCVIDKNNTAGFNTDNDTAMVAIFTHHNNTATNGDVQQQSIAFSLDAGRTWKKYANNPVIKNTSHRDFRDPKVFWYDEGGYWVMALAVKNHIAFYQSFNLKQWNYLSEFGADAGTHDGVWECPDLFPMSVDGTNNKKWVLLVSVNAGGPNGGCAIQYFIGDFNGTTFFTDSNETNWLDYGTDCFAGVTFNNLPDANRTLIAWMNNWAYAQEVPTHPWRGSMTMARNIELREGNGHYLLASMPVNNYEHALGSDSLCISNQSQYLVSDNDIIRSSSFQIKAELDLSKDSIVEMELSNHHEALKLVYNKNKGVLLIDRCQGAFHFNKIHDNLIKVPVNYQANQLLTLDLWFDKASMELFINEGRKVATVQMFTERPFSRIQILSKSDNYTIKKLIVKSIKRSIANNKALKDNSPVY